MRAEEQGHTPSYPRLCASLASHPSRVGQAVHNALFRELNLPFVYVAFGVEDTRAAVQAIRSLGIRGVGVSMPHKVRIMGMLDHIDSVAEQIGAVNTVLNEDGVLRGTNLDWVGITRAMETSRSIEDTRAVVLGAGGAARAAVFALRKGRAASVTVYNRSATRGETLARDLGVSFGGGLGEVRPDYDILVQATSLGHLANPGGCPLGGEQIAEGALFMEVVAEPCPTPLHRLALSKECVVVPGYRMRLHQAAAQFELYTGVFPPLQRMEALLLSAMGLQTSLSSLCGEKRESE